MKPTETFACPHCGHRFTTNAGTMALLIRTENRAIYCAECDKLVRDDEWVSVGQMSLLGDG